MSDQNKEVEQETNQEQLQEKIKKSMSIEVPESLQPQQIEKMLQKRRPRKSPGKAITIAVAVAAVFILGSSAILWNMQSGVFKGINGGEYSIKAVSKSDAEGDTEIKGLTQAKNYAQVRKLLGNYWSNYYSDVAFVQEDYGVGYVPESGIVQGSSETADADSNTSKAIRSETGAEYSTVEEYARVESSEEQSDISNQETEHSETNIREEGVEEADTMLTDGDYIYCWAFDSDEISLIKPDKGTGKMELISEIELEDERVYGELEMYLADNSLVVVYSVEEENNIYENSTLAVTYDISDRTAPVKKGEIRITGRYETSRMVDGYLYLFTRYGDSIFYYDGEQYRTDKSGLEKLLTKQDRYVPCVQGDKLKPEEIYIPDIDQAQAYLVGVSMSIEQPDKVTDQFAVLMDNSSYYVSRQHIYLMETKQTDEQDDTKSYHNQTLINALLYEDGTMKPSASGVVPGMVRDSFCVDEYDGYLRAVTTVTTTQKVRQRISNLDGEDYVWYTDTASTSNSLYVLDGQLQIVGQIEGLAEGERIYSARFMGEEGYFVTFRETDPVFSVDLSDPENPKLMGELKLTGFSDYLHPYGTNRLLGIGEERDSNVSGVKLSMFDITDMQHVQEIDKLVERDAYSYVTGSNYKAVFVDFKKNLFGFVVGTYAYRGGMGLDYHIYRYDQEQGFSLVASVPLADGEYYMDSVRGMYIKDIVYVLAGNTVQSVSLEDGSVLDSLKLMR